MLKTQKVRDAALQAVFVAGLVAVLASVVLTAKSNLDAKGMTSGLAFLSRSTGWDIGFSFLPYSIRDPYWWALLMGLLNTVVVGYLSIVLATLLGAGIAAMRMSGNPVLRLVGVVYVDAIRNVPPILQLFIWYAFVMALPPPRQAIVLGDSVFLSARGIFIPGLNIGGGAGFAAALLALVAAGAALWILLSKRWRHLDRGRARQLAGGITALAAVAIVALLAMARLPDTGLLNLPHLRGLNIVGGIQLPPELSAMIIAMTVYGAAYVAEIVRAGFNAVPPGQAEAGWALGLTPWQIFVRVRAPLAIRNMLPAMANQYVWLIKASTLGVAIGFADLFLVVSSSINQIGQTLELIAILIAAFWMLNHSLAWALDRLNDSLKLKG